jgi:hypothetical protein
MSDTPPARNIMPLPHDYVERVYAGVLGKLIGVYLGRPFEGWTHEAILAELGEIDYYVNDRMPGQPLLVVPDDDLSGTFTFLRALPDHGYTRHLTPEQIGNTWLNYIVEGRTILWWGGLGNSTEHTAYLRLKRGVPAPRSGSAALNGGIVAEQIGAQIFVDGWAMAAPGDPALAADLARRAASVSHDGEAVYAAQVIAAMEAQAFVEADIQRLIDTGLGCIPPDSIIARLIQDAREWHARLPDWRSARARLEAEYGYHRYGGNCHVVPNHGLVLLGLIYGEGDLQRSLRIVNTSGWDTDCNSGNLGCLLGIRAGLAAFEGGPDWRGPVADRLYLSTADGGRAITDAVIETYHVVNAGRALAGQPALRPKGGARFHFELLGSVQGFELEGVEGAACLENVPGHSRRGGRSLAAHWQGSASLRTPTFIPPEALHHQGYTLMASPTLYPGQELRAGLSAAGENSGPVTAQVFIRAYGPDEEVVAAAGPETRLAPGEYAEVHWRVPETGGAPICAVGFHLGGAGTLYLDYLTWDGVPETTFTRPGVAVAPWQGPALWRRMWVNAVDQWLDDWRAPYDLVQNAGRGLLSLGSRDWTDYQVSAVVMPALIAAGGVAARVQGLRRYYALLLVPGAARLIKMLDTETVLAETPFEWQAWQSYNLRLELEGSRLRGWIDGNLLCDVRDGTWPLTGGGIGLVVEEGHLAAGPVSIGPAGRSPDESSH